MDSLRVIPTKVHGMLDYASVLMLAALPFVLKANRKTRALSLGAAGKVLLSSLFTRYELGLFKVVPMPGHLAMDFALGTSLLGYAQGAEDENKGARAALATLGVVSVAASLLTQERMRPEITDEVAP